MNERIVLALTLSVIAVNLISASSVTPSTSSGEETPETSAPIEIAISSSDEMNPISKTPFERDRKRRIANKEAWQQRELIELERRKSAREALAAKMQ